MNTSGQLGSLLSVCKGNRFALLRTNPIKNQSNNLKKRTRQTANKIVQPSVFKKNKPRNRRKYSYERNLTMSRKINHCDPMDTTDEFCPRFQLQQVNHPEIIDAISDHAYRRVQLFYYQCVAYYNSKCTIRLGHTILQHGRSKHYWSQAAHSSILPHVTDDFFDRMKKRLLKNGMSKKAHTTLEAVGGLVQPEMVDWMGFTKRDINRILHEVDTENGLISKRSSFYHTLNSTVELPSSVNQFDTIIESRLRGKAVEILNKASKRKKPYEALTEFVQVLQNFFTKCEQEILFKIEGLKKILNLEKEILELEDDLAEENLESYVEKLSELGKYYHFVQRTHTYYPSVRVFNRLPWHTHYFHLKSPISKRAKESILYNIQTHEWAPEPITDKIDSLLLSLDILRKQRKSSVMPEEKYLSGKLKDGERVKLTTQELWQQKLELIMCC